MPKSQPVLCLNPDKERSHFSFSKRNFVARTVKTHFHNFIEIEFLLKGYGQQILNGTKTDMPTGCLTVLRLTDYHSISYAENATVLNFSFDENMVSEEMQNRLCVQVKPIQMLANDAQAAAIQNLFSLCLAESQRAFPNEKYIKNLLECLMITLFDATVQNNSENEVVHYPIQNIVRYLKTHFKENPSLSTVAGLFHYSSCHFSTFFHKQTGSTYSDYLLLLKINYAKQLLLNSDLNIETICYESGFLSYSRFLQAFKATVHLTPTQFRCFK